MTYKVVSLHTGEPGERRGVVKLLVIPKKIEINRVRLNHCCFFFHVNNKDKKVGRTSIGIASNYIEHLMFKDN